MKNLSRHRSAVAFALLLACSLGCKSTTSSTSTSAPKSDSVRSTNPSPNTNIAVGIGGARCGFVVYQIQSDGSLDGIRGGGGSDKTGTEKATKQ